MFNIDTYKAHKQGIRENMESNLIWDKYHGTMKHKTSSYPEHKQVEILFNDAPADAAIKYELVAMLYANGTKVEVTEITEQPYCTTYTIGTRFVYEVPTIRTHITDRQVEQAMKLLIRNKIRKATGRDYVQVECKVMDFFKTGVIDWNQVIKSHEEDCSL